MLEELSTLLRWCWAQDEGAIANRDRWVHVYMFTFPFEMSLHDHTGRSRRGDPDGRVIILEYNTGSPPRPTLDIYKHIYTCRDRGRFSSFLVFSPDSGSHGSSAAETALPLLCHLSTSAARWKLAGQCSTLRLLLATSPGPLTGDTGSSTMRALCMEIIRMELPWKWCVHPRIIRWARRMSASLIVAACHCMSVGFHSHAAARGQTCWMGSVRW